MDGMVAPNAGLVSGLRRKILLRDDRGNGTRGRGIGVFVAAQDEPGQDNPKGKQSNERARRQEG